MIKVKLGHPVKYGWMSHIRLSSLSLFSESPPKYSKGIYDEDKFMGERIVMEETSVETHVYEKERGCLIC
jgi:hypothetical protein